VAPSSQQRSERKLPGSYECIAECKEETRRAPGNLSPFRWRVPRSRRKFAGTSLLFRYNFFHSQTQRAFAPFSGERPYRISNRQPMLELAEQFLRGEWPAELDEADECAQALHCRVQDTLEDPGNSTPDSCFHSNVGVIFPGPPDTKTAGKDSQTCSCCHQITNRYDTKVRVKSADTRCKKDKRSKQCKRAQSLLMQHFDTLQDERSKCEMTTNPP